MKDVPDSIPDEVVETLPDDLPEEAEGYIHLLHKYIGELEAMLEDKHSETPKYMEILDETENINLNKEEARDALDAAKRIKKKTDKKYDFDF